jgi:dihydropyrimidine dehydrogenase (NAD+) subunit PreA
LTRLKKDFPDKVIVASIMGNCEEEWTHLARLVTKAGVDLIECNFSCPHMSYEGLGSDVGQNPALVKRYTECTRLGTHLPILAKMTPNLGNMEIPALAANEGGADGIAAINTIKSLTGIYLQNFSAPPSVHGKSSVSGYSGKAVKPIALRFINDLACHPTLAGIPLSGMGGIETWQDALEFILLGCSNVQVTTSVMQYGYRIIEDLIFGLQSFMEEQGVSQLSELVGAARSNIIPADELDRQSIVYPLIDRKLCIGCGRCYLSCLDAGHQALSFGEDRVVHLDAKKCKGCHLCLLVCPMGAIHQGKRVAKPLPKE